MNPQARLVAEIVRARASSRAATDHFTAVVPMDEVGTFSFCRRVLVAFEEAGVPPDATIQWSGDRVYAMWRREVI